MKKFLFILSLLVSLGYSNLSEQEYKEIKETLSLLESQGNYKAQNSRGFLGKYQFGAATLVDVGLIKKDKYQESTIVVNKKTIWKKGLTQQKFLNDPNNWIIKGGKNTFLTNNNIQEKAMDKLQIERR